MKEVSPRWMFDCGHCQLSWQCGPVCACDKSVKPNPKKQMWFPVRVPGTHWKSQRGLGAAEVRYTRLTKGSRVAYRLGKRPDAGGVLRVASKWSWGVLARVTSRLDGQTWGFKVLSIEPEGKA